MLEVRPPPSSSCTHCGPVGWKSLLGLCLVICVGPKLLSLLDYVHFDGLVYHLHEKLTA